MRRFEPGPEEIVFQQDEMESLRNGLTSLSYRARRILELRYGLGDEHPRTLHELARTFNVTRERIRQVENEALTKLQTSDIARFREKESL